MDGQCLPRCEGCGFLDRCFNCPRRAQDRDCGCQFALLHRADNESQHNEDGASSHYSHPGSRRQSSRRYRRQPSIIQQPVSEQPDDDDDNDGGADGDSDDDGEGGGVVSGSHLRNYDENDIKSNVNSQNDWQEASVSG